MSLDSILERLAGQPAIPRRKKRLLPARFFVETLENRVLLTTYTVTSTSPGAGGGGALTLFDAIGSVDADTNQPGTDTINFNIPTSDPGYNSTTGVWTIDALVLPNITHAVKIDGTTQSGYSAGHPVIDIDGTQAATRNQFNGLVFTVGGNTIEGLIINNFQGFGIILDGTNDLLTNTGQGPGINNTIQVNFLGTDAGGQNAAPNGTRGIDIFNSSYNLIGGVNANGQLTDGNLISGNGGTGVYLGPAPTATITSKAITSVPT